MYLITTATAVFSEFVVKSSLIVGDATETAQNLIRSERLFRIGVASDLGYVENKRNKVDVSADQSMFLKPYAPVSLLYKVRQTMNNCRSNRRWLEDRREE
jgi:hypothetical protein